MAAAKKKTPVKKKQPAKKKPTKIAGAGGGFVLKKPVKKPTTKKA